MDPVVTCLLCGEPSDQPGRWCTACVGPQPALRRVDPWAAFELGGARVVELRLLQWPITLLLLGVCGLAGMRTVLLAERLRGTALPAAAAAVDRQVAVAGVVMIGAAAVLWLVWWAIAYANLRRLGVEPRSRPAWAVVAWGIPIADLVVPQRVADELWKGSDPHAPLGWREPAWARRAGIVRAWWLAGLGAAACVAVGGTAPAAQAAGAVLLAIAGISAALLVTGITARQRARARLLTEAGLDFVR